MWRCMSLYKNAFPIFRSCACYQTPPESAKKSSIGCKVMLFGKAKQSKLMCEVAKHVSHFQFEWSDAIEVVMWWQGLLSTHSRPSKVRFCKIACFMLPALMLSWVANYFPSIVTMRECRHRQTMWRGWHRCHPSQLKNENCTFSNFFENHYNHLILDRPPFVTRQPRKGVTWARERRSHLEC